MMGRHTLNRGKALRYVRRHAWQFHGAGVHDAVRDLPGINAVPAMRDALTKVAASLNIPGPLRFEWEDTPLLSETAHGLTVVGYKDQVITGTYFCPGDRLPGTVPVTAADVTCDTECIRCGTRLLGPTVAPAQCPDCSHAHVEGQNCIASMGPGFCGCTG